MDWDLSNFQQITLSRGLPDSSVYCQALFYKYGKALILTDKYQETWTNFWDLYSQISNEQPYLNAFIQAQLESETYIEAALQNLHSIADILCQIINVVILESTLHEAEVNVAKTIQELNNRNLDKVKIALNNLCNSNEFKYIAAFVNTIKHRRLLDTDYHGEFGRGTENTMGIRFHAFTYNRQNKPIENYPVILASTIIEDYMPNIKALIESLGMAIEESI
ncbi:hypothetical protein [Nostoc sp. MS1]|uniref:hypothetical protein n=1 Tax=Nostoc sp. MS1 TaxID=2764711 RepID=UPI001CC82088|nr:hypothetical protein [Nostoc sp. MS1]BCL34519.1 hypothetical protein NSMS1_09660 [Nostoc sp. MS1]